MKSLGQIAYEADVAESPRYHDGEPRRTWQQLTSAVRQGWDMAANRAANLARDEKSK